MLLIKKALKHLQDSNMSYFYHFWHSVSNGNRLLKYVLSSYVHAIFPGKWRQHAARGIMHIYEDMKKWPHLQKAMKEVEEEHRTKNAGR